MIVRLRHSLFQISFSISQQSVYPAILLNNRFYLRGLFDMEVTQAITFLDLKVISSRLYLYSANGQLRTNCYSAYLSMYYLCSTN